MFSQKELYDIQSKARISQTEVTNPIWIRACERIEDASCCLERLMEGSKIKDKDTYIKEE